MPPFAANVGNTPNPPPPGGTRELPGDIDALDAELGALRGLSLAMSDGSGTWMRLRVVLLVPGGCKPTAVLSDVEFLLLGHSRHPASGISNCLELTVEDVVFGTQGTLRLMFPASGWRLHAVLPATPASTATPSAPAPASSAPPQADADESARRKRDDIFRRMFS